MTTRKLTIVSRLGFGALSLFALATSLSACLTQGVNEDYTDTRCKGYLGCSANQKIVTPEPKITPPPPSDAGPPPANDAGSDAGAPPVSINAIIKGPGCGMPLPANQATTVVGQPGGYTQFTVMGTGVNLTGTVIDAKKGPRTFWVRVPADYNPDNAYRVVYVGQGCGGYNAANTSTLALYKEKYGGTEQAIYVAIDLPTDMANMDCYDNRDGPTSQEWEAFQLMHDVVDSHYCVDENRIYISGYSTGGWLSNMYGCYFAGDGMHPASNPSAPRKFAPRVHIRGQAGVSGGEPPNNPPCNGPVAALWIHDTTDGNAISGNYDACARALRMNGCKNTSRCEDTAAKTTPWHPDIPMLSTCQQYDGCPADYPVVFCKTVGLGHSSQDQPAIAAFNLFFKMMNPAP
jgi:poly(3-hydroxybutyrate) depolymerase